MNTMQSKFFAAVVLSILACGASAQNPMNWTDNEPSSGIETWQPFVGIALGFVIAFWLFLSRHSPMQDWFEKNKGWGAIFLWLFPLVFGFIFVAVFQ